MHLYLIEIRFIHRDANDNCKYLTTEEESGLSTVCVAGARKSFSQASPRLMSRSAVPALSLFQVQFTNPISLSHCRGCLDTPDSLSIAGAILRSSHYGTFYGNMFCVLTFVSSDFPRYACYLVVCSAQIIPVVALSIILNMGMGFCFI